MEDKGENSGDRLEVHIEIDAGEHADQINEEQLVRFAVEKIMSAITIDPDRGTVSFEPERG